MNARKSVWALAIVLALALPCFAQTQPQSPLARSGSAAFRNHVDPNSMSNTSNTGFVNRLDDTSWGSTAACILDLTTNPTDADTVTIGADVYEFCVLATNDDLANNTNIGVVRGADAATTALSLIAAINGTDTNCLHDTIDNLDGTAARACGTEDVMARAVTQASCTECIQVRTAEATGEFSVPGLGAAANPSIVFAEGLTAAGNIWECGVGVNLNAQGGRAPQPFGWAIQCKTLIAAHITNSTRWTFPFTVTNFIVTIRDTNGAIRMDGDLSTDLFTIDEGDVVGIFGGGAAPDTQATDVVCVIAFP